MLDINESFDLVKSVVTPTGSCMTIELKAFCFLYHLQESVNRLDTPLPLTLNVSNITLCDLVLL